MNVPRPANQNTPPTTPTARDSGLQVLAEFDLGGIHCLLIPADDEASPGAQCEASPSGARSLCGFELDGHRYVLYARTGPGRTADVGSDDPLAALTAREQQIVRLVCLGMVNKQIAYKLRISEYTVKTYLKQIFCKLNVHSRSAMVYRCAAWSTVRSTGSN